MSAILKNTEAANLDNITESEFQAIKECIYPGAPDFAIKMAINYCKVMKLDPMLKAVHLVSRKYFDKVTQEWKEIWSVMPGVGLYRILAARSERYAGLSDVEFGPDKTERLENVTVTYPIWAKVSVRKLLPNGSIGEFSSGKIFWKEEYATAKKDSSAPGPMWLKRPYGQLGKCAESQGLRKAFPEIITQVPTFEEMEGKDYIDHVKPTEIKHIPRAKNEEIKVDEDGVIIEIQQSKQIVSEDTYNELIGTIQLAESLSVVTKEELNSCLEKAKVSDFKEIEEGRAKAIIKKLSSKIDVKYDKETTAA